MLFPKVPTGIPGLDPLLGGGYTKNSLIAVSGGTGSGRTTFAAQFLVNGYLQNQEPGLYLSFDEPKFSIFANMSSFRWELPAMERDKHVVFIEYPQMELSNFLEQEGSLLELIDTLGVERVVFDSITPLALLSEGDERRRFMQKLVNVIRRWGVTALITADDLTPADPHLPRTSIGIEALADGYIHLGTRLQGSRRVRTLEVVKMRGSAHAHHIHRCHIDSEGFKLSGAAPELPGFPDDVAGDGPAAPEAPLRASAAASPRLPSPASARAGASRPRPNAAGLSTAPSSPSAKRPLPLKPIPKPSARASSLASLRAPPASSPAPRPPSASPVLRGLSFAQPSNPSSSRPAPPRPSEASLPPASPVRAPAPGASPRTPPAPPAAAPTRAQTASLLLKRRLKPRPPADGE